MSMMPLKYLLERPAFTAAVSFFGYIFRYEMAVFMTRFYEMMFGVSYFFGASEVGTAFLVLGTLAALAHLSEEGVSLPELPSVGSSSSTPTGVRNWSQRPRVPSSIYCPVCGYNADVTAEQRAKRCGECRYGSKRADHWKIPEVVGDEEEYGELREDYVRGELSYYEFEEEVEDTIEVEPLVGLE